MPNIYGLSLAPIKLDSCYFFFPPLDRGKQIKDHDGAKWNKMCTSVCFGLFCFSSKGNINLTWVFQLKRILIAVHNKQKIQTTIILKLLAALYFYQGIRVPFQH